MGYTEEDLYAFRSLAKIRDSARSEDLSKEDLLRFKELGWVGSIDMRAPPCFEITDKGRAVLSE